MSKSVLDTIREYTKDPQNREDLDTHEIELDLCDRMIELRETLGLTQQQLAEKLGFSQGYIAKLENGAYDRCGIGTLRRFALALGHDLNLESLFRPSETYLWPAYSDKLLASFCSDLSHSEPLESLRADAGIEFSCLIEPDGDPKRKLAA